MCEEEHCQHRLIETQNTATDIEASEQENRVSRFIGSVLNINPNSATYIQRQAEISSVCMCGGGMCPNCAGLTALSFLPAIASRIRERYSSEQS